MNYLKETIYGIMASKSISQITSKFISQTQIKINDLQSNLFQVKKIKEFPLGEDPKQICFYKEQILVTCMKEATLEIIDWQKDKVSKINLPGMPVEILVSEEQKMIFVSEMGKGENGKNSVIGIDINNYEIITRIETQGQWSKFMTLSEENKELWVSNWLSNDISIIDLEQLKLKEKIPAGKTPRGMVFTRDNQYCYVCGYYSRDVLKFETATKKLIKRIIMPFPLSSYQGTPRHIIMDKKNEFAYISNMGRGVIHKLDLKKDQIINTIESGRRTATIKMTPDERFLLAANNGENSITVIDLEKFKLVEQIFTAGKVYGLDINEQGNKLAVASFDKRLLEIYDLNYEGN